MRVDWERFKPRYWMQNTRTDWEWDAILNDLLDRYEPVEEYLTVQLGGVEVWTGNWPYAYGRPYNPKADVLPSVATRKRLRDAIQSDPLAEVRNAALK